MATICVGISSNTLAALGAKSFVAIVSPTLWMALSYAILSFE